MPDIVAIPASKIGVDYTYQRPIIREHVNDIARTFDPDKVGAIVVSGRADGSYWVLDGQHRIAAMRLIGYDDPVQCVVYSGLSIKREATMFAAQADARRVPPIYLYQAKVASGDARYMAVDAIVRAVGYEVTLQRRGPDVIQSPQALFTIYNEGGADQLEYILTLLADVWAGADTTPPAHVILGLHYLTMRYRGYDLDVDRLVDVIRKTPFRDLRQMADVYSATFRERKTKSYGRAMMEVYNRKLKDGKRRLPPWDGGGAPLVNEGSADGGESSV